MPRLKILIAEDDKFTQSLYEKGLPKDRYERRMAGNGEEALEIYRSWNPDIVVLDIMMPVLSGYEALKQIREEEPTPDSAGNKKEGKSTVIIMATAMSSKDDIMDCLKLRINGYLVKPINHRKINEQIMGYYNKANPK